MNMAIDENEVRAKIEASKRAVKLFRDRERRWNARCRRLGIPPALLKATEDDPFDYALGLRDGTIIRFGGATIIGDWVHLSDINSVIGGDVPEDRTIPFCLERGVDVRLNAIAWCADAPDGS